MANQSAVSQLDRTFAALSDPGRRAMLSRLSVGPATVSELAEPLNMTLSAVLQHINYLEDTGLVSTRKEGRTRVVEPATGGMDAARDWIAAHEAAWHSRFDRLGAALDSLHADATQPTEN
jgi:DNA-binding transcriptional ArsR family regulator